ncbi:UbiA prenyltransferase family protein [Chloroflexota bacterium]
MNQALRSFLGLGLAAKETYSVTDKLLGILNLVPPIFLLLTPINAASAVVLSLQGFPPLEKCVLGLIAVAFAGGGVVALNSYFDRNRDRAIWPERPIPSERIKASSALIYALSLFTGALLCSWFFFNPVNFSILLVAIILGALYSAYLRDKVGYLSLPPIVGLIYLGGWAAFSPETLFTSPLPWYLYLLGLVWQAAHIMVYYPLHLTSGANGKPVMKLPAFFFIPTPQLAVGLGLGFLVLTILMSSFLPLLTPLSGLYLVLVLAAGGYALYNGSRFLRNTASRERGLKTFASLTIFRLAISAAILLDIFLFHRL